MNDELQPTNPDWFEDAEESLDYQIKEYEVTHTPNDFNLLTLVSFIDSGAIKIPDFQRNYVWDIKRASKLIESILIGLPIPQVFLYEESRNTFLVIDGQQRLMSIYYFTKGRFPKKEKRAELRAVFAKRGRIPKEILNDDDYFVPFKLQLSSAHKDHPNKFNKLSYDFLEDLKTTFDLRTVRNVIIKQTTPSEDDSSMFEIFHRLNTGGINLKPQEIRTSLYHSEFYNMIYRLNEMPSWRMVTGLKVADLNMKDCEFILRCFALLVNGEKYQPPMTRFLNEFSRIMKGAKPEKVTYFETLFCAFLLACSALPERSFNGAGGRFSISILESVFTAMCESAYKEMKTITSKVPTALIQNLRSNQGFMNAVQVDSAGKANVDLRLKIAKEELAKLLA